MILEQLMERKDLHIYIKLRRLMIRKEQNKIKDQLRDPDVSPKKKKKLMKTLYILNGRFRELRTSMKSLHNGRHGIKDASKRYWKFLNLHTGDKI